MVVFARTFCAHVSMGHPRGRNGTRGIFVADIVVVDVVAVRFLLDYSVSAAPLAYDTFRTAIPVRCDALLAHFCPFLY